MRKYLWISLMLLAQWTTAQDSDTTIYDFAQEPPRFPACERLDTTLDAKKQCSQQALLATIYSNVRYPLEARQNGNEGQVVVSFVVNTDSTISNFEVLRDIGGGCGQAVLNVLAAFNQAGVKWIPGKLEGKDIRSRMTLPIKFKLKEAPPFVIVDGDSVYTKVDTPLNYEGGTEQLMAYIENNLKYPDSGLDSCLIGSFDVQVLVSPDQTAQVLDLTDYNNLGFDFIAAVSDVITGTFGKWQPAIYKERKVPSTFDVSLTFVPEAAHCQTVADRYDTAVSIANEGSNLYNEGKKEEGIAKLTEALEMFPDNGNFLLMRGQAYLDSNNYTQACQDLSKAKSIAGISWYDSILPVICKVKSEK